MMTRFHDEHTGALQMVSPYLLRPVRSYEQAKADIEARRARANVVMAFVPAMAVTTTTLALDTSVAA